MPIYVGIDAHLDKFPTTSYHKEARFCWLFSLRNLKKRFDCVTVEAVRLVQMFTTIRAMAFLKCFMSVDYNEKKRKKNERRAGSE